MKAIEQVYQALRKLEQKNAKGISAHDISLEISADRTNVSRYLNQLCEEKRVVKLGGRPVLYQSVKTEQQNIACADIESSFDRIAGVQASLQTPIQQAKAAILYPPKGLHTLLLGETGVGKSMFAELMYQFAKDSVVINENAPFIRFNCADYAENSQLLISQIFGVKKGAYTGADKDKDGLLKKADGGFLFLDEVHRLSAQGQEMLFTFIDKGIFRPLGETEKTLRADVRIIAATTEQPQSCLLNTFTRRIPMVIELPPLRDKNLTERYYLIELFIKQESRRIGKSIYADKNAVISFLLYDCPNNIGQLKSDIQLACAKAFLNYKSKKEDFIHITSSDLPQHVDRGMLQINRRRDEIDFLLNSKSPSIRFSCKDDPDCGIGSFEYVNEDFYDGIERRLKALKSTGMKDEEINYAINMEIESHFKRYLGDIPKELRKKDIGRIVGQDVLTVSEEVLSFAEDKLKRNFSYTIKIGLALHMHGFIKRVKKGISIYHPKLNSIRIEYPDEFMTAMEAAKLIDSAFDIQTPLDEIGYLAMFFLDNPLKLNEEDKSKVGILVMMHGKSAASSMAEVCNAMVGAPHAHALDMPLHTSPETIYPLAKEKALELDKGRGVLILTDMGSLASFGQMIQEETGIVVRTIDMASTPTIIDACRKAVLGRDIYYIYDSIKGVGQNAYKQIWQEDEEERYIIITACFTGEGAAEKLKKLIEQELEDQAIQVIPLNIMNKRDFFRHIEKLREKHRILLIVSTVEIETGDVPAVFAADLLSGSVDVKKLVEIEKGYIKIAKSLKSHLDFECDEFVGILRRLIDGMASELGISLNNEVKIGILLHMAFMIDRLRKSGKKIAFPNIEAYSLQNREMLDIVSKHLMTLKKQYNIEIGKQESAYICKALLSNLEVD